MSPNYIHEIPLAKLASVFGQVAIELDGIPTLHQLSRRSNHAIETFSTKYGGYRTFKRKAIEYLFSTNIRMPPSVRSALMEELDSIQSDFSTKSDSASMEQATALTESNAFSETHPHHQGRTLNFRAFTYAPTCEHDVVQMFGAVAHELGFEIIGNRALFQIARHVGR